MLYKFKSKATGDLIMLEANGRRVLDIIGKDPGPKGIILPEQMEAAIVALQAAIAKDEAQHHRQAEASVVSEIAEHDPADNHVSLRQRAAPFIEMLRQCMAEQKEIVWGV